MGTKASKEESNLFLKVKKRWKHVPLHYKFGTHCEIKAILPIVISSISSDMKNTNKIIKYLRSTDYTSALSQVIIDSSSYIKSVSIKLKTFNLGHYEGDKDYIFINDNKVYTYEIKAKLQDIKDNKNSHITTDFIRDIEHEISYLDQGWEKGYDPTIVPGTNSHITLLTSKFFVSKFNCDEINE
jgi:hypothetical protein